MAGLGALAGLGAPAGLCLYLREAGGRAEPPALCGCDIAPVSCGFFRLCVILQ